ncbi:tail fiber protein [Gilliamella sp.]|uniref:tail fiber protein n=1 Tax=Gilliamella sp. TaxID=1891236 RepID=UPI0025D45746|nr:tail fiber protein [Gilliamella sp.]
MNIQEKPDYLIFADSAKKGEVSEFPDVSRGWGVTIDQTGSKPPLEWMNGAFNRVDKNILYLLQQGVPEWCKSVKYPANAIIKYNGVLYTAIAENDNSNPATNTTKWKKTQAEIVNASTSQSGVVKLSSNANSTSETEAATPKAVKSAYDLASNAVKKSGDEMTGQLSLSPASYGIKFSHENGNVLVLRPDGDNFIYSYYDAKSNKWTNKLYYVSSSNTWHFEDINDVTINNKSVLKKGDFGIGSLTGAIANNFNNHLSGGFYQCMTTDFPDLHLGNSAATLLVYPSNSETWKVEQLSVVNSNEPRVYYRCDTKGGKQKWHEAITTANIKDFAYELKGDLANKSLNWLTGTEAGVYFQGRNAQAIIENGYPINQAGTLQVFKNGADGAGCCQIYTTYKNSRQFIRNYLGSPKTWEPWVEFYTTANRELAGLIDKFEASEFESRVYSHDKRFYLLVRDDGVIGMFNKARGEMPWWFAEDGVLRGGYVPADRVLNLEQYIRNFTMPPGIPLLWPHDRPPEGWFECNGAQFDVNQFPRLGAVYHWGQLPDLRGEFIRGWDNGRGADQGRTILSWQNCEIQRHSHGQNIKVYAEQGTGNPWGSGGDRFEHDYWFNTGEAGGNETRPRNIAFMYIVKAE